MAGGSSPEGGEEGKIRLYASVGVVPSCLPCGDGELFGRRLLEGYRVGLTMVRREGG